MLDQKSRHPNAWFAAVTAAGKILQKNPDTKFVDRQLPVTVLGFKPDIAQLSLLEIFNASLDRVTYHGAVEFNNVVAERNEDCLYAETLLSDTFAAMSDPNKLATDFRSRKIGWRILTSNDLAVGVTKTVNYAHTTLMLEPVVDHGIPFPAGSLFSLELPGLKVPAAGERQVASLNSTTNSAFQRITAFALPPDERTSIFSDLRLVGADEALLNWSIADIREIAQRALSFSQMTQPIGQVAMYAQSH
jgi:hypothetical protein